jgi:two-component system response regulator DevR
MMERPLRVLIVDDHEVVREGLRSLLNRREAINVVGEAGTVATAIEEAARLRPDVVIMDVRLPDGSGVEACREIRQENPDTKVIMLTSYADDEAVFASILAGAAGYLLKQTRGQALAEAIEAVAQGGSLLDPAVTQKVLERVRSLGGRRPDDSLASLSEQEQKILLLIAEGKTNKEIAEEIFLSDKTVKNYVSSILSKLNLRRRAEAAAFIARKGLGRAEEEKEE